MWDKDFLVLCFYIRVRSGARIRKSVTKNVATTDQFICIKETLAKGARFRDCRDLLALER